MGEDLWRDLLQLLSLLPEPPGAGEWCAVVGVLVHEGDLEVGTEVFIEDEQGELQPAEDGEYLHEEEIIIVAEGKVAEIREVKPEQPEEQPAEDPEPEKMDEETEAALAEKDARIAELEAQITQNK